MNLISLLQELESYERLDCVYKDLNHLKIAQINAKGWVPAQKDISHIPVGPNLVMNKDNLAARQLYAKICTLNNILPSLIECLEGKLKPDDLASRLEYEWHTQKQNAKLN